jgi:hypothetical protein
MSLPSIFEYLPEQARDLCKVAAGPHSNPVQEEPSPAQRAGGVVKTVGTGLLGFGLGSLAGAGGAALLDKWHEAATGQKIPLTALHAVAPVVGGAMGLAYNIYKARELEELRRALESKSDRSQGRIPRQ